MKQSTREVVAALAAGPATRAELMQRSGRSATIVDRVLKALREEASPLLVNHRRERAQKGTAPDYLRRQRTRPPPRGFLRPGVPAPATPLEAAWRGLL